MAGRPLSQALRAGCVAVEAASRAPAAAQARAFCSSSNQQSKQVITFSPTSSAALDADLALIRDKVLLPSYLHGDQRKMLHKRKYAEKLRQQPVIMELDDQRIRFEYTDPTKGTFPNTRKTLIAATQKMRTPEDFANLPKLLEGLWYRAGRRFPDADYAKVARLAGHQGCIYSALECARRVRWTGFALDTSEKVNCLLYFIQDKAIDAKWSKAEATQALKWAESVLELLQDPRHQTKKPAFQPLADDPTAPAPFPLARDPQVIAAALHLAAGIAVRHHDGQDTDGSVTRYARDVVSLWPEDRGLLNLHPKPSYVSRRGHWYLNDDNIALSYAAPLLHGMDMALKVLGGDLAAALAKRRMALAAEVDRLVANPEVKGRGRTMYEKLYGQGNEKA